MGKGKSKAGAASAATKKKTASLENSALKTGIPTSERKDFYYHLDAAGSPKDIKYDNVLVNIDYPQKLVGTPKQISYAESLINRKLFNEVKYIIDKFPQRYFVNGMDGKRELIIDQLIANGKKIDNSINTFSDLVNYKLKNTKNGVLAYLKKTNKAGDIISKFK